MRWRRWACGHGLNNAPAQPSCRQKTKKKNAPVIFSLLNRPGSSFYRDRHIHTQQPLAHLRDSQIRKISCRRNTLPDGKRQNKRELAITANSLYSWNVPNHNQGSCDWIVVRISSPTTTYVKSANASLGVMPKSSASSCIDWLKFLRRDMYSF